MSPLSAFARTEWSRQMARALINGGFVEEEVLTPLLSEAAESGAPFGVLLITRGVAPASVVVSTLAQLARLPAIDLETDQPTPELTELIPTLLAHDHQAVTVRVVGKQAVVAFAEPPEAADIRSLGELIGYEVVPVLGDPLAIGRFLGGGNGPEPGGAAGPPVLDPRLVG